MTPLDIIALLSQYGAVAALVLVAYGGMAGKFLWRSSHDEIVNQIGERLEEWQQRYEAMERDRDYWRDQAWRALGTAERLAPEGRR